MRRTHLVFFLWLPAAALNGALSSVVLAEPPLQVNSFALIDAKSNQTIQTLHDGIELNLDRLGTDSVNIVAAATPAVASVSFRVNGAKQGRVETARPFALRGDKGGRFLPWTPKPGKYEIEATPIGRGSQKGAPARLTVVFSRGKPKDNTVAAAQPAKPKPLAEADINVANISREQPAAPVDARSRMASNVQPAETAAPARGPEAALYGKNVSFSISSAELVPPAAKPLSGKCLSFISGADKSLTVACTHNVPSPSEAALKKGRSGEDGRKLCDVAGSGASIMSSCALSPEITAALGQGLLYLEVRSKNDPALGARGRIEINTAKTGP